MDPQRTPKNNVHEVIISHAPKSFLSNPLKSYLRIGRVFFGITFVVNISSGIILNKKEIAQAPCAYIFGVLCKSICYIPMWPAIPIELVTNPQAYCTLGGSFKK